VVGKWDATESQRPGNYYNKKVNDACINDKVYLGKITMLLALNGVQVERK
jgi:hypothetical protein